MTSITFSDLLTIIYILVDDWYQDYGEKYCQRKVGRKPVFTDSEVMTLMLAQEIIPFPSESSFLWRHRGILEQILGNAGRGTGRLTQTVSFVDDFRQKTRSR